MGRSIAILVFAVSTAGCHTTPPAAGGCTKNEECPSGQVCKDSKCEPMQMMMDKTCTQTSDCPVGTGVCRNMKCAQVPCSMSMPCMAGETCTGPMGMMKCAPMAAKGTPGRTLASGGSVSTSGKHIHIGLTGQGRAVGPGGSAQHKHTGGATAVLGRPGDK